MTTSPPSITSEAAPVLLELGKALLVCQAFEGTLVMLLATMSHEAATGEAGAFGAAVDLFSQRTLGQLLKRLEEKLAPMSPELETRLFEGWNSRNWIVHEFLHKTIEDLMSPSGRLKAEALLEQAKLTVKVADIAANEVLDTLLKKYGMSVASLKENAERVWNHLNAPASSLSQ